MDAAYAVEPENFLSQGRGTPFAGMEVYGECLLTIVGGKIGMKNDSTEKLVLENGEEYYGRGFGDGARVCELVFNTSMVGYQEIVSDPSYTDQIVVMTYPLIGNYGTADDDFETKTPTIGGLIVREYNDNPSNFRYTHTLSEILEENHIPGIEGLDTRQLTRSIRDFGSRQALICDADTPRAERPWSSCARRQCRTTRSAVSAAKSAGIRARPTTSINVVAVDCGIKLNIIRSLNARGCNVTVVP